MMFSKSYSSGFVASLGCLALVASPLAAELRSGAAGIEVQTVGAWIETVVVGDVTCRNLSTGQSLRALTPADSHFDCEEMGLAASPGDRIGINVRGAAE